ATPGRGVYDAASGAWVVGPLAVGETVTLNLAGTVTVPGSYTDTARVTGVDQFDTDPSNDQASQTVRTGAADLSLTKTVDNAAPSVGDTVTFTLVLTDTGPDAATGVRVTDQLPAGLAFVSATPTAGNYDA